MKKRNKYTSAKSDFEDWLLKLSRNCKKRVKENKKPIIITVEIFKSKRYKGFRTITRWHNLIDFYKKLSDDDI